MYDFYSDFSSALNEGDISAANATLMKELAAILVRDKSDFVDMLNESGVMADSDMSDAELIQLFVDNAKSNKKLILAAALLVNIHNKKMGFDGEDEIDDELVKQSYFTMKSCFVDNPNGEEYSYIAPFLVAPLLGAGVKLAGKGIQAAKERQDSKQKMQEEARRKREEERRRREEARQKEKDKQRNMLLIGGIAIVGILVVGFIIMRKK